MMKNAPLLVTGAAGFIGSRFIESCNARGVSVISCDEKDFFSQRPLLASSRLKPLQFGTTLDISELIPWLEKTRPKLRGIVHMGACSKTTETNWDFLKARNIDFSQSLWNFSTAHRVPFVYASSAATYGAGIKGFSPFDPDAYNDDEALFSKLEPLNLYGKSKLLFDVWALEQEKAQKTPPSWAGFKFFNVYGIGEDYKASMASVPHHAFAQIQQTGKVKLFKSHKEGVADGEQKRDFIWAEDVVDALWFALEKPISRGIYNLGSGQARTFLDLVRPIFPALGVPEQIEFIETPMSLRPQYQYFTQAKMERLRSQGWTRQITPIEKAIPALVRSKLQ